MLSWKYVLKITICLKYDTQAKSCALVTRNLRMSPDESRFELPRDMVQGGDLDGLQTDTRASRFKAIIIISFSQGYT